MTNRKFHLRLNCTYKSNVNDINDLSVQTFNNNEWEPLSLDITSPGFLLFISGLFSCQHMYMRTNSAERNLVIESAAGDLQLTAGEYWDIKHVAITFHVKLISGTPTKDDINYIIDRMKHCPVSTNMPDSIQIKTSIFFDQ